NQRPIVFRSMTAGRRLAEVPVPREVFGGPRGLAVDGVAAGPEGALIVGSYVGPAGLVTAEVWQSHDRLTWDPGGSDPALAGGHREIVKARLAAWGAGGLLVAGDAFNLSRAGDIDAALWWSASGHDWQRVGATGSGLVGVGRQSVSAVSAWRNGFVA